ncbi:iron chelate uptake ABC transporter family permease subunit [Shinella sp. YE25]|uniref:iron chelate uptake ABC transporter family permease subunit n=1 Tax=Shinella sp. YE25 TaxID=2862958 RepID=UPI00225C49B8|nr:iron chelate uptake ABC transporter family permease subunit [Shinella sp. YE25]CAI0334533.1 hypothetical protein SHINE37_110260 [Rhizobiaceae bacterium]CAK7260708.1 protein of unknown function [Shinella sp. WSC3-e]
MALALLLEGALGMSGAIFQSLTRNPPGSPDITGLAAAPIRSHLVRPLAGDREEFYSDPR